LIDKKTVCLACFDSLLFSYTYPLNTGIQLPPPSRNTLFYAHANEIEDSVLSLSSYSVVKTCAFTGSVFYSFLPPPTVLMPYFSSGIVK